MWRLALVLIVAAGCSQPSRSPHGDGKGTAAPDAGVAPAAPDAAPPAAPITEAECDTLIDHILAIITVQARDDLPPDDRVAAEAKAHASLRAEFLDQCLQLDRTGFECMLNAPDKAAFASCGEP